MHRLLKRLLGIGRSKPQDDGVGQWTPLPATAMSLPDDWGQWLGATDGAPSQAEPKLRQPEEAAEDPRRPAGAKATTSCGNDLVAVLRTYNRQMTEEERQILRRRLQRGQ